MNTQQAYNTWAGQYDTNHNKTRDLEAIALRDTLSLLSFDSCLEIGCGTGKNTSWLVEKAKHVTAVDFSESMLAKAQEKITAPHVAFVQADITMPWCFVYKPYNLVSFSLVLEHIETLASIFGEAANALHTGGYVYVGELHPFKQYTGSKARFDTGERLHVVPCYNHHLSDFVQAAKKHQLRLATLAEYFADNDRTTIPRILALLFIKD